MRAHIEPPEWMERPHRERTARGIERAVEWIEERTTPFTTSDVWRGSWPGSYTTARETVRSMHQAGLIVKLPTSARYPRHAPYIRYDLAHQWS